MVFSDDVSRLKMSLAAAEAKAALLDLLPTPVIEIGKDYTVAYLNPAAAVLLGVNRQHAIGMNSHNVLRTPQCHAGRCMCHQSLLANATVTGEAVVDPGGLNLPIRYTAAPVEDSAGNQVGALLSLEELQQEQHLADEIHALATAVQQGDLSARGRSAEFAGQAERIVCDLNAMLNAVQSPVRTLSHYVDRMARGEFSETLPETYPGELGDLQHAVLRCRDAVCEVMDETNRTTAAIARGKLERRIELSKFKGQWADVARGLNDAVESLLTPVRDIGRVLEKIAAGNLKARVTTTYQGDFHMLKVACNQIGAQVQEVQDVIEALKTAVLRGQLVNQAELRQLKGQFAAIVSMVNEIVTAVNMPLVTFSDYLDQIAGGHLPPKIIDEYKGSFQHITLSINGLIEYFHQIKDAVEAVAHGDLSISLNPRSDQDVLTPAFQRMTTTLQQFLIELSAVAEAVTGGQLEARGNASALHGDFTRSMRSLNRMIGAVIGPLHLTSEYLDRIAAGNLPAKLVEQAPGDFGAIQQRTNRCIETLNALCDDMLMMADASVQGDWDQRADITPYDGIWAALVKSANTTAGQVSATIEDVGGMLHRLAAGDFEARLTHEYKGDYNVLKNACNDLGEQVRHMHQMLTGLHAAIHNGHLEARIDLGALKGEFAGMMRDVNRVLDAMNAPIRDLAAYVTHLAGGELPEKISQQYQGDFQLFKESLNALRTKLSEIVQMARHTANGNLRIPITECSARDELSRSLNAMQQSLATVVNEVHRQVHAIQEGRLGMRSNALAATGCWRDMLADMNTMVDTCLTPFLVMTDHVNRIAGGEIPEKVTEEFRGEFNSVRTTLNHLIETVMQVQLVARQITDSDLEVMIQKQSEKDVLMGTLHEMVNAVQAMVESPETLAKSWRIPVPQTDEAPDALGQTFHHMVTNFQMMMGEMQKSVSDIQQQNWLRSGQTALEQILQDHQNIPTLARNLITFLVKHVKAHVGAVYLSHEADHAQVLRLTGSYAYSVRKGNRAEFALGEGLIGQAALEKEMIVFSEVPDDYMVSSGLGRTTLRYILVLPCLHAGELIGVIELGTVREFTEAQMQFLRQISDSVAMAFQAAKNRMATGEVPARQQESVELQQHQSELRVRQQELEQQVLALQESREKLCQQEEELHGRHSELNTQAHALRESELKLQQRQEELRRRHRKLETQAKALRETEQKLQRQQQQLRGRHAVLESQSRVMQRADQIQAHADQLHARQKQIQAQSKTVRESERALQQQREELRKNYEELEARVRMLQDSEERIQQQRGNLRAQYEDLEERGAMLQEFETKLQAQQEKLDQKDHSLSQQMRALETQQQDLQEKQQKLEKTRQFVQAKMKELEVSGRYHPEFLVNLSYKLRTSLNRLLVLSNLLAENADKTLSEKQVEFAGTINAAVSTLLGLVNQVLHLIKIECGSVDLIVENISVRGLANYIEQRFTPLAREKGLRLCVDISDGLPVMVKTARQYVEQILKHLLSNAIKFTEHGSITVHIGRPGSHVTFALEELGPFNTIALSITDTGIGIPESKLDMIFEAFQQAESTIGRKFGGMGLGLALCRGLARLLGGEIQVQSAQGQGSTFTLYLPENLSNDRARMLPEIPRADAFPVVMPSDRRHPETSAQPRPREHEVVPPEPAVLPQSVSSLLIVESGTRIHTIVTDLVNGHPITVRNAMTGREAYETLQTTSFDCMILDLELDDIPGNELLDMLEEDGKQTTLPVLVYTPYRLHPHEEHHLRRHVKSRIIDVTNSLDSVKATIVPLLPKYPPEPEEFHVPEEIINLLADEEPVQQPLPPNDQEPAEQATAELIPEEDFVVDEDVSRELQQVEALLLEQQQELRMFRSKDAVLDRRIILLVSRERTNVYTIMNVLQEKGVQILFAENAQEVMQQLESRSDVDLVLIENVLANKDGCEVIRAIRSQARYVKLPIIALMVTTNPDDYQRCLDAGANDYLFKPVDTDELLSLLRVWLY